ncbi:Cisplatin damage response ATP-dependent DNA ligase [Rhodovastum atsumiense]|uniref:Cisplatin damage response ATP-dependent DNA ligase n=1 Tax=Rhodovastum atsumiense TaxID=504468 RepID=A0A5M6IPK7_9PROT|nr:cisplatin damage response ATP-dependent DNA ligase [Rhodovastum atsumiense]KAA5610214.1 cisplatin damage response ATP-dependent DNA ligase [Rhodovastum atsumiense]CAH2604170.1 Cisplatin damage response ATP-dependent DNA ligase [Rhodovastum atsumiense]
MTPFADLLERLAFTPGQDARIALLRRYFATTPDPDRGFGLAVLGGAPGFTAARPALLRALATARTDPELFAWSHEHVGDLAETVALMWPATAPAGAAAPALAEVVTTLQAASRADLPGIVAGWLDAISDASVRFALLRLVTGGLRTGIPARLARIAVAELAEGRITSDAIDEVWHSLTPPYGTLFAWVEGRGPRPDPGEAPTFHPPMQAPPLHAPDLAGLDPAALRAEWKWDGLRVQLAATPGGRRLFSADAEDISAAFPDILAAMEFQAVLEGELLAVRDGAVAPFAELRPRLNRRTVTARIMRDMPVAVRLYDILFEDGEDLRPLPFDARRARLEKWHGRTRPARMDLSPMIPFTGLAELATLHGGTRDAAIAGLMLRRGDAPYLPGPQPGLCWTWQRDPLTRLAVLMYAQRGQARPGSGYSDCTFGLWRPAATEGEDLVPVGKAEFAGCEQDLAWLDRWIRAHTIARFGPVREVEKALVLEIAFDAAQLSSRHRSGVTLRSPRIVRLRTDTPAALADRLAGLMRLVENHPVADALMA